MEVHFKEHTSKSGVTGIYLSVHLKEQCLSKWRLPPSKGQETCDEINIKFPSKKMLKSILYNVGVIIYDGQIFSSWMYLKYKRKFQD